MNESLQALNSKVYKKYVVFSQQQVRYIHNVDLNQNLQLFGMSESLQGNN